MRLAICGILLLCAPCGADLFLVHVGGSEYRSITSLDQVPLGATRILRVADVPGGPAPGPEDPPSSDPVVAQVVKITNDTVRTKDEALVLQSTLKIVFGDGGDISKAPEILKATIGFLAKSEDLPGNNLQQWLDGILGLAGDTFTEKFAGQVQSGVTKATAKYQTNTISDRAVASANGDEEATREVAKLDIGRILRLIEIIREMLAFFRMGAG